MSHPAAVALADDARGRWGEAAVRPIERDGAANAESSLPLLVLEPADAEALAGMLAWADGRQLAVVPRGSGTKSGWGVAPARCDILLSLARLDTPIEHCAGDLTATLPAGAHLGDVNATLGRAGQWLPVDPTAGDGCSIGGLLATNDSGPRRLRYGTPRDLVIGVEMVLADGRRAKAGGRVVKNVAGYDLGRLLTGSYGALAVVTSATFKLSPVPPASCTVIARPSGPREVAALARAIADAPLTPTAIEVDDPSPRLLVRFESTTAAAHRQADQALDVCVERGVSATTVSGPLEADAWTAYAADSNDLVDALLKITILPTALEDLLTMVDREARDRGLRWRLFGRATLGVLFCRMAGAVADLTSFVLRLRDAVGPRFGRVVVLAGDPALKAAVSPWGELGGAARVMRAVKAQLDPRGTLCPGGGPGGIA